MNELKLFIILLLIALIGETFYIAYLLEKLKRLTRKESGSIEGE